MRIYISLFLILTLASCSHFGSKPSTGNFKIGEPYKIAGKLYTPKDQQDYDEVGMASWYGSDFHNKETANGGTFNRNALTAAHKTLPLPSMVKVTNLSNNKTLIVMINDRGPFAKERIIDLSERAAEILGFKDNGVAKVRVQFLPGQTKRLLSDLPNANANSKHDKKSVLNIIPKLFKTSSESTVIENPVAAPSKNSFATASAAETTPQKSTQLAQLTPAEKAASKAPLAPYADSEDELPNPSSNALQKPPTAGEEKPEEITGPTYYIQAGTYGVMENAKRTQKSLSSLGTVNIKQLTIKDKTLYRIKIGPILDKKIAELTLKKTITLGHPDALLVKED